MRMVKKYGDYAAYLADQRAKTLAPETRARFADRRAGRVTSFRRQFEHLLAGLPPALPAVCLGARYGEEVEALRSLGHDAIGVDLVEHPPLVTEADFHALPFADGQFRLV